MKYHNDDPYEPAAWSAMRIVGLFSLVATLAAYVAFYHMAQTRRRRIIAAHQQQQQQQQQGNDSSSTSLDDTAERAPPLPPCLSKTHKNRHYGVKRSRGVDFGGATAQQTDASGVAVETCIQREQQSRDIEMNDDDSSATSEKHENYKEMVGRQGSEVYNGIVKLPEGKTLKDYLYFF